MSAIVRAVALAGLLSLSPTAFAAQDYPTRPIRLILSSPPGGAVDLIARTLARALTGRLGQQLIVDNRPGGGQVVGTNIAAHSEPDGYTLLVVSITHAINPGLNMELPYDSEKDFAPISMLAESPLVLVAHTSLNVRSVAELIKRAQSDPGAMNYAGGTASGGHLAMALLLEMTNTRMVHIAYNGAAPALNDVAAGRVPVMMTSPLAAGSHVRSGKLLVIAVSSRARSAAMPEVPTIGETVPGYEASLWYALLAPEGLSHALIARLNEITKDALSSEDVRKFFATRGVEAKGSTSAECSEFISAEIRKWRRVIANAGIRRR